MDVQQGLSILGIAVIMFLLCVCGILVYLKTKAEEDVHDVEFKLFEEQARGDGWEARAKAADDTIEEQRDRIKSLIGQLHNGTRKNGDDTE